MAIPEKQKVSADLAIIQDALKYVNTYEPKLSLLEQRCTKTFLDTVKERMSALEARLYVTLDHEEDSIPDVQEYEALMLIRAVRHANILFKEVISKMKENYPEMFSEKKSLESHIKVNLPFFLDEVIWNASEKWLDRIHSETHLVNGFVKGFQEIRKAMGENPFENFLDIYMQYQITKAACHAYLIMPTNIKDYEELMQIMEDAMVLCIQQVALPETAKRMQQKLDQARSSIPVDEPFTLPHLVLDEEE